MAFPPEVSAFINADGTVVVPARVAERMLRLVTLGVIAGRQRGVYVDADMVIALDAMQVAAMSVNRRQPSATGTTGRRAANVDVDAEPVLLSTDEAAARIGCSSRAVRAAIERGQLRATRPGGRAWVIREDDLDDYAHGGRHVPNPDHGQHADAQRVDGADLDDDRRRQRPHGEGA